METIGRKDGNGMDTYNAAGNDRELTDSMGDGIDALLANLRARREALANDGNENEPTTADIRASMERGDWS